MSANGAFRLWAMGCSHVGSDLRKGERESLAHAIRQSETGGQEGGPPFDWDMALHLGDLTGSQYPPDDDEGREVQRQMAVARLHRREHFYHLVGNHDASGPGEETQWWFRTWIDPTGEHGGVSGVDPHRRPYPLRGTWERYTVEVGNVLFLVMGDRNDVAPPVGRGHHGGYPAGAITEETFRWWCEQVEGHRDRIIVTCHHHMLRETTVASGPWEGFARDPDGTWRSLYHGYFADGGPKGASYLYFLGRRPDARAFEGYLAEHPGAIDLWLGGHTHTHPDDRTGGRSHIETRWGVHFVNCAGLTRYHGLAEWVGIHMVPMSRLFAFEEGSDKVRVRCYLHTSDHAPQGWYDPAERSLKLSRSFHWEP